MSDEKKSIEQWERERGLVLNGNGDPSMEVTNQQFTALLTRHGFVGVNHADRENWLRDNGYEINRANLINSQLSTRKKEGGA